MVQIGENGGLRCKNEKVKIKKNGFWVAKQGLTHEKGIRPIWSPKSVILFPFVESKTVERDKREKKKMKEEEEAKLRYGFSDFCMEIMDSGMILVYELLGYGLLGFYLDINLVPLSRVLLGRHLNSRFKGSLVEKP